jgi:signal peptidase I
MKVLKVFLWIAAILGAIWGILYLTVFDVWTVPLNDPAMTVAIEPAITAGDVVLVARRGAPDRGYLMRCPDPRAENPGGYVVARVISNKAGERVTIENEVVSVDGHRTPSAFACDPLTIKDPQTDEEIEMTCSWEETGETKFAALRAKVRALPSFAATTEPGKIFLVSDNRHMHIDSRDFGAIDPVGCQHVLFRLWGKEGIMETKRRFSFIW